MNQEVHTCPDRGLGALP